MFREKQRVKILKKPEGSNNWLEVGRGFVMGLSYGSNYEPIFIKYVDEEWPDSMLSCPEFIAIDAPRVRVVKC